MYRALYDFAGNQQGCLSFQTGDQFTALDEIGGNWLRVQNGFGQIGLVPYNYVTLEKAAHTEVLKSIDRAIEAIHYAASAHGDVYTVQQRENLQRLIQHRRKVVDDQKSLREGRSISLPAASSLPPQPKRMAPGLISPTSENHTGASGSCENKRSCIKREAPQPPPRISSQLSQPNDVDLPQGNGDPNTASAGDTDFPAPPPPQVEVTDTPAPPESLNQSPPQSSILNTSQSSYKTPMSAYMTPDSSMTMSVSSDGTPRRESLSVKSPVWGSPTKTLQDVTVPAFLASELIEKLRRNTGLSYDKTRVAIETVVSLIGERVPSVQSVMEKVSLLLLKVQDDDVDLEGSHDAQRLRVIFSEINDCKDDSQQRSWALHEDESIILEYLQELLSILENAKPSICRKMISIDNYEPLHNLVQYYQMEIRVTIRLALLKVFGALCELDHVAISSLLYSVLPLELSLELQTNITNIKRSSHIALVLTMLFSMGEDLPINHYVQLNQDFIRFLLDKIETPPNEDASGQIPDLFTNLILSFNLHLRGRDENIVMAVLAERGTSTVFTEKLMVLVNRGDDPVRMFKHEPKPTNSLMKFLTDLYSDPATSDLFYTNDAHVLVDIIIRQLSDLPTGDKLRSDYLTLVFLLLKNSPYHEARYRFDELQQCLVNIVREEDAESDKDKLIIQQLFHELPHLFQ